MSAATKAALKLLSAKHPAIKSFIRSRFLLLMMIPGILYFVIFKYWPMYGIVIAFKDYNPFKGVVNSPWVGFKHFYEFFNGPYAFRLIRNTLLINIYQLIFTFFPPVFLAIAFNEIRNKYFKRIGQSITFLPHFISSVVIVGLAVNFLDPINGIVNITLTSLFGIKPISFLSDPQYFRSIYISIDIWKGIGWGAIIYLAALSGINPELYEAAQIDGANKFKQVWHITLPELTPIIVILLIFNIGSLLDLGVGQILLLYNPSIYETADVIGTFVYRRGLLGAEYSFSAAIDLFNSIISLILIAGSNYLSKRLTEYGLW